jgi:ABC-type multidrug transport system fused ATPase/permease subunit
MFWLTGPIMSFVSICAYNIIYDKMNLSNILTGLFIFYLLADPLFLLPEYINGLVDSLLSLKRIEIFLNKKEYNPKELVKNINSNQNAKFAIEIDGLDFGIIKKREEFEKDETENEINENKDDKKEIELKDIDLSKYEKEKDEKKIKLLSKDTHINNKKEIKEENKNEIKLEVKESKNEENIPEIEIIDLLYDIKLKVEKGDLIGIVGPIGAGKTCLLNAILNNLDALNNPDSKKIKINGSIAYIPQKAWILNDTIKNNILFKHPFNAEKYDIVIKLCQLLPDFDLFKQGDLTMISDKGANLSGGQKTRINIARAVYSDSDIYLFDDPLSALDSHVGEAIFTDLIKNYLRNKTVLVVTHALQYIPMMNKVLYMDDGKILFYGKPEDAMNLPFFKNALSLEERKKFSELSRKQGKSRGKKMKEFEETEQESFSSSDLHLMIKKIKKKRKRRFSSI